ncbi:MAG: T9SS type A sorting domain-containing protein [Chitinophagales bacterium]|nr:T9SS type A sorting domain-containing protein [Chitinophagales bacterium]
MKTADPEATAYNPSSSDWVQKIIDLSPYESYGIATLIFRSINGYGNNFYIDDININSGFGTGVESHSTSSSVSIAPNPGNGLYNVQLPNTNSEKRIVVINALGQIVYDKLIQDNSFVVDISLMPSGMYFLRIDGKGISVSEKIVIDK